MGLFCQWQSFQVKVVIVFLGERMVVELVIPSVHVHNELRVALQNAIKSTVESGRVAQKSSSRSISMVIQVSGRVHVVAVVHLSDRQASRSGYEARSMARATQIVIQVRNS